MNAADKPETKERILKIAEELFSQFGYEGASIREIASQSDTNIAAINYHFKSKENLYWVVMERSHNKLEEGITKIRKSVNSISELAIQTFEFIQNDPKSFKNAIKMMLSDGVSHPSDEIESQPHSLDNIGPPGYQSFLPLLRQECPQGISEKALDWGVKSIFSTVMWWSVFSCSDKLKRGQLNRAAHVDYFVAHIKIHVQMTVDTLKNRHESISQELPEIKI